MLGPGAVHVWRADLATVSEELAALLSASEQARAERFPAMLDGRLWARGRGVLRALLGRYLQRDPRILAFVSGPHGKPALAEDPAWSDAPVARRTNGAALHFNMSHSGDVALYAFTKMGPIGVDVELARRPIDALALAARAFGPAAAERLRLTDPSRRQQEFLRAWVRHEAALKRVGAGLGGHAATTRAGERAPWIVELEMGPSAAAAVALEARPDELCCLELPGDRPLA